MYQSARLTPVTDGRLVPRLCSFYAPPKLIGCRSRLLACRLIPSSCKTLRDPRAKLRSPLAAWLYCDFPKLAHEFCLRKTDTDEHLKSNVEAGETIYTDEAQHYKYPP